MQSFFIRRLPKPKAKAVVLAGVGGAIAIAALLALSKILLTTLVIAPFGATCVLIFAVPSAPLSQPVNVVGGHMVSAIAGMLAFLLLPDFWWFPALGVGLAIAAMVALRVTHPPAGANPLVIALLQPDWWFVLLPVSLGAFLLVMIGLIYHRTSGNQYPVAD